MPQKPLVIDLFAGCGGLTEGFKNAGFEVVAAVEMDKHAAASYRRNHPDVSLLEEDINNKDIVNKLRECLAGREVDVVIGGPPCQSFSIIGRAKDPGSMESDPRNKLVSRYVKLIEELQPKFLMMENVPGIMSAKYGQIYTALMKKLKAQGYITHSEKLNAAHYGVPQLRNRIIFVGNRIGIGEQCSGEELAEVLFPQKTHWAPYYWHSIESAEPNPDEAYLKRFLTLRDAISDLPEIEAAGGENPYPYNHKSYQLTDYQKRMRKGAKRTVIYNHIARYNNPKDLVRYATLKPGQVAKDLPKRLRIYRQDIFDDKFKRQSWNRPSTTIVAHMQKDGNMFIHPEQVRSLTAREAARLQSFPDRFIFEGPRNSWYKQIGNAVPPLMAEAIAQHIRLMLESEMEYSKRLKQNIHKH